jgi:hypothetical protein
VTSADLQSIARSAAVTQPIDGYGGSTVEVQASHNARPSPLALHPRGADRGRMTAPYLPIRRLGVRYYGRWARSHRRAWMALWPTIQSTIAAMATTTAPNTLQMTFPPCTSPDTRT